MPIDALSVLCAQLTRDLLAIATFLLCLVYDLKFGNANRFLYIKFILLFCILSVCRDNVITSLIYLWAVPYSNFESLMTHWIRIYFQQRRKYSIWFTYQCRMSSFTRALSLPSSSASLSCAVATYSAEAPPKMHQNSSFSDKKSKKISGRGHGPLLRPLPQWGEGHPLPTPQTPRRLRRLDSARAFSARNPQL